MKSMENLNLISEEQQERPEKFTNFDSLKSEIAEYLLPNLDSTMRPEFMEYLNENNLKRDKYFLANAFIAMMSGEKLPDQSEYEFYDNKDGKIESIINSMIINVQEKAS
jgi:hypothetical protein